jgi:serine/threonine protein kinase
VRLVAVSLVYRAHDRDLGRDVALKVIRSAAEHADAQAYEQRFLNEARAAARLSHPAIVVVHDVGRDPASGALFMALELLRGRTMQAILREHGALPWAEGAEAGRARGRRPAPRPRARDRPP